MFRSRLKNSRQRSLPRRRTPRFEQLEPRQLLAFNPTGFEQELFQLINRFRTDPQGELGRLVDRIDPISSPFPEINRNLVFWKVNGPVLAQQWQSLVPVAPVGWHEALYNAAAGHNQEMIKQNDQQHQFPGEPDPGQRMRNAGYPTLGWAENIAAYCTTVIECHGAYALDWGPGPNGIQNPPGHRITLMNGTYLEVGSAITERPGFQFPDVGPLVNTQDFARRANIGNAYAVGAVFDDKNSSKWYDSGEGLGGATVSFKGPAGTFQTTTLSAGGYQVQLPPGTYTGTASGGGLREPLHMGQVVVAASNVWVNFAQIANALAPDRLEPNNDFDTPTEITAIDQRLENLSIHLPDNDDYFRWTAPANGRLNVKLTFDNSQGNLDLFLYDVARNEVASSKSDTNQESVAVDVKTRSSWYIVVAGRDRAINPAYALEVDGPGGAVPLANDDKTATDKNQAVAIDLLANDTDADGDLVPSTVQVTQQPQHGTITINQQTGAATYTPPTDYLGVARFRYTVRDATNLTSQEAGVVVAVVDYSQNPWRNPNTVMDVDASGQVVPQDALVVINRLNANGPGALPANPTGVNSPPPFVDTSGDDFLSPNDALRVINFLNRQANAEGESHDEALRGLLASPASEAAFPVAEDFEASVPLLPVRDAPLYWPVVRPALAESSAPFPETRRLAAVDAAFGEIELDLWGETDGGALGASVRR